MRGNRLGQHNAVIPQGTQHSAKTKKRQRMSLPQPPKRTSPNSMFMASRTTRQFKYSSIVLDIQFKVIHRSSPTMFSPTLRIANQIGFVFEAYSFLCVWIMDILSLSMSVHHMHAWCSQRPEKSESLGNWSYRWWEPPCGCWKLNLKPLDEQPVLLTAVPSLQSRFCL